MLGRIGSRRQAYAAILIGAGLLLVTALSAALLSGGGAAPAVSLPANALGLVNPATGDPRGSIPIGGTPGRVQASGGQVWVTSDDARAVGRVDTRTPAIGRVVPIRGFPSDFALGEGAVWVVDGLRGRLLKISPDYGTVLGSSGIGSTAGLTTIDDRFDLDPWSVAAGAGGIWITDGSSTLRRAEPASGKIVRRYDVGRPLNGVAVDERAVWAISGSSGRCCASTPAGAR